MTTRRLPKSATGLLATFGLASLALAGCAGGGGDATPSVTGEPTSYESVEELRDAYVAAGGECPNWEELDPGDYDAVAGRCSDQVVISVYNDPSQIEGVVQSALDLAIPAHLLVGENWIINTPNPEDFVDALGGGVVTG
ncbi:hypothetical protein [Gulosibacter molinativorax]|uniref:hypothetical protein n=1 Tax=Gulosibacter molinativorax TaxID=256821 RepID=UPI0011B1E309|nr:hypothetical protein [Gulosibacter molinativorax]